MIHKAPGFCNATECNIQQLIYKEAQAIAPGGPEYLTKVVVVFLKKIQVKSLGGNIVESVEMQQKNLRSIQKG